MSLLLLKQIAAMFLMVGVGVLLVKLRILQSSASRVLSLLTIYVVAPCAIVRSFQLELTQELLRNFLFIVLVAVALHVLLMVIAFVLKRLGLDGVERASVLYSNCANLLFPIVAAVLGSEWVVYSSGFFCVQTFFLWSHGKALVSGEARPEWKKLLTNCNLIAVFVGLALMLLRIELPDVLSTALNGFASTLAPLSMLIIGILLANADLNAIFAQRRVWLVAALKLLALPLLALPLLKLASLFPGAPADAKSLLYTSFLAVAAPTATMITQLAQLHERRPEYAGAINVMTTLLCIATMPLLTELYMRFI